MYASVLNSKFIQDLRREIKKTEKDTASARKELKYWIDFKNKGTLDLSFQIELLKKEIADMNFNYEIISGFFKKFEIFNFFKKSNQRNFLFIKTIFKKIWRTQ